MHTRDVVFTLSLETLDDVISREFCRPPDQTLLALARDNRVGNLFSADPWRSRPIAWARGRATRLASRETVGDRELTRVRPMRYRRQDATALNRVRQAYMTYGEALGQVLRDTSGVSGSASLVTYHPFVAAWCRPDWVTHTVYVGRDDWSASARLRRWHPLFEQAYRDLRRPDVSGFAVSEELSARLSPDGRATVVPNGVDAPRWRPQRGRPASYDALPGPLAIYAGTIDDRLDLSLVDETLSQVGTFVLVGPVHDEQLRRRLESHERILLVGVVGQDELAALVQHADLGVVPHRDTALTRAMSPLKLYEYLAGGLPVVARDLPPMRDVHDLVYLADEGDWTEQVCAALAMGHMSEARRQEAVDAFSWERRQVPVVDAALRPTMGLA